MVDSEFRYSYEYQGISPKLVHTSLTDDCYLTLTQVRIKRRRPGGVRIAGTIFEIDQTEAGEKRGFIENSLDQAKARHIHCLYVRHWTMRCRRCRDVFQCFCTHTHLLRCVRFGVRQAMHMGFGGNPYGPAGTGKTESVKALGYLFGRQVLVFNCDEGIDIKSLTRILIGLARCGAWGCFDEFNRLEDSTLSMISTRIHPIQEAIKNKETSFVLENQKVKIEQLPLFISLRCLPISSRNTIPTF